VTGSSGLRSFFYRLTSGRKRLFLIGIAIASAGLGFLTYFLSLPPSAPTDATEREIEASLDFDDTPLHRPSPLPYYVHAGSSWHGKLIGLPEGDLDLKFLDALIPGDELPLAVTREYRSGIAYAGVFGRGWISNLDVRLVASPETLSVRESDGRIIAYRREGSLFVPMSEPALFNTVARTVDAYVRRWKNGKVERFDQAGRLVEISLKGHVLRLHHPDSASSPVDWLADQSGHRLLLSYVGGRLASIETPTHRVTRYAYQDDRLATVTDPTERSVSFIYKENRLARIDLPAGEAVSIAYDNYGKVRTIEGPGALRTDFAWRKLENQSGVELQSTLADGEVEITRFQAAPFVPAAWSMASRAMDARAVGLDVVHIDAAGIKTHLFQIDDRILLKQDGTSGSVAIDPSRMQRLGGDRPEKALSQDDVRNLAGALQPGAMWRSRLPPGMVGSRIKGAQYDEAGRVTAIPTKNGMERWRWDDADRIVDWFSSTGVQTHYDYDALDHVKSATVNGVAAASVEYNDMGLPTRVLGGNGRETRYGYNRAGHIVSIARSDGNVLTYARDRAGRITIIAMNGKPLESISYDADGHIARIAKWRGQSSTYGYDAYGRLSRETNGAGVATSYSYDSLGRVAETRSSKGIRTTYQYETGRISSTSHLSDGRTTVQTIDGVNRSITTRSAAGQSTTLQYDSSGEPVANHDTSGVTSYETDAQQRLTRVRRPDGSQRTYKYDGADHITEVTDGSHVLRFDYGGDGGILLHNQYPAGERLSRYDARGLLIAENDVRGRTTQYAYDAAQRLIAVSGPEGKQLKYQYDSNGRVTAVHLAGDSGVASLLYSYNSDGRLLSVTHEDGTHEHFVYDSSSRIAQRTNRTGQTLAYHYDAAGRVQSIVAPSGTFMNKYDQAGRLIERDDPVEGSYHFEYRPGGIVLIDPEGARTKFDFDSRGALISEQDALGGKTARRYDSLGRIVALLNADGQQGTWTYGANGRSAAYRSPLGKITRDEFDDSGRLVSQFFPGNRSIKFTYDTSGRLSALNASDGKAWNYGYDDDGRPISLTGPEGSSHFTFNGNGQALSYVTPWGDAIAYSYDAAGRLASQKTPRLGLVRYRYDSNGRVAGIAAGKIDTRYTYDAVGRPAMIAYSNGTSVVYAYDKGLRVASITLQNSHHATLYQEAYRYDSRGNVMTLADPDGTRTFSYDALNRVTRVQNADGTIETFSYDAIGNIVRHNSDVFRFDADGARIARNGLGIVPDAAGSDCAQDRVKGHCTIHFDALGRVERVDEKAGERNYLWDGAGNLLRISGSGIDERFVYANGAIAEDVGATTGSTRLYTPGLIGGQWSSVMINGQRLYPVWSPAGTLRVLVDEHGKIVTRYIAGLFGLSHVQGDNNVPFVFGGGTYDDALHAVRFGMRYLGVDGAFLTQDPHGPDKDGNLYSYALDNPLRFKDSAGAASSPVTLSWTEVVGGGPSGITISRPVSITIPAPTPLSQLPLPRSSLLPVNLAPPPGTNLGPSVYPAWNGDWRASQQTLAEIALRDPNPIVRAAASDTLRTMATRGTQVTVAPFAIDASGSPKLSTGGEAALGSDQVTLFEQGINTNLYPGENPTLRSAGALSHEVEHASVQLPESVEPYTTKHEWDAFYQQAKIDAWSAEGLPRASTIVDPADPFNPRTVYGIIMDNPAYERARLNDIKSLAADPNYQTLESRIFEDLGNDIRRGREITIGGHEATITQGGTYEISTAPGVSYDVGTGQITELASGGQPISVSDQIARLREVRSEAEVATRPLPSLTFEENVAVTEAKGTTATNAATEANQTRQLTELDLERPLANSGELSGAELVEGGRNIEQSLARDLVAQGSTQGEKTLSQVAINSAMDSSNKEVQMIFTCADGTCWDFNSGKRVNFDGSPFPSGPSESAIVGATPSEIKNANATTIINGRPVEPNAAIINGHPVEPNAAVINGGPVEPNAAIINGRPVEPNAASNPNGNVIFECENGECYEMSDKGFARVNPDGTPYVEPGAVNPKAATGEVVYPNGTTGEVVNPKGTTGEVIYHNGATGEVVNPNGTTGEVVNPKGTTAEVAAGEGDVVAQGESRIARAELDAVVENARAPIASEIEASASSLGSVESAIAREAGTAEIAAVERSAAQALTEEAVASVERKALSVAAKDAAYSLGRSAWTTVAEFAPAQFVRELVMPVSGALLEAANPVFTVLLVNDVAHFVAKVCGWAGRKVGNILANPLDKAFNRPEFAAVSEEELARQRYRRLAARQAIIGPEPRVLELWSPSAIETAATAQAAAPEAATNQGSNSNGPNPSAPSTGSGQEGSTGSSSNTSHYPLPSGPLGEEPGAPGTNGPATPPPRAVSSGGDTGNTTIPTRPGQPAASQAGQSPSSPNATVKPVSTNAENEAPSPTSSPDTKPAATSTPDTTRTGARVSSAPTGAASSYSDASEGQTNSLTPTPFGPFANSRSSAKPGVAPEEARAGLNRMARNEPTGYPPPRIALTTTMGSVASQSIDSPNCGATPIGEAIDPNHPRPPCASDQEEIGGPAAGQPGNSNPAATPEAEPPKTPLPIEASLPPESPIECNTSGEEPNCAAGPTENGKPEAIGGAAALPPGNSNSAEGPQATNPEHSGPDETGEPAKSHSAPGNTEGPLATSQQNAAAAPNSLAAPDPTDPLNVCGPFDPLNPCWSHWKPTKPNSGAPEEGPRPSSSTTLAASQPPESPPLQSTPRPSNAPALAASPQPESPPSQSTTATSSYTFPSQPGAYHGPTRIEMRGNGPQSIDDAYKQGGLFGALAYGWNGLTNAIDQKVTRWLGG
jgi:RHS repeat-associated protein